jgi:hypothetical protein
MIGVNAPEVIEFQIPLITKTLNQTRRMHFQDIHRYQLRLMGEIKLVALRQIPAKPWERARVTIWRHSCGTPDKDGLIGGMKELIDCLIWCGEPIKVASKASHGKVRWRFPHPCGLGFILDDNPACIDLDVQSVKATTRSEQKTVVRIERLSQP